MQGDKCTFMGSSVWGLYRRLCMSSELAATDKQERFPGICSTLKGKDSNDPVMISTSSTEKDLGEWRMSRLPQRNGYKEAKWDDFLEEKDPSCWSFWWILSKDVLHERSRCKCGSWNEHVPLCKDISQWVNLTSRREGAVIARIND